MNRFELSAAIWIKSSYSGENGGNCLEVAPEFRSVVPVRDSKRPGGPVAVSPSSTMVPGCVVCTKKSHWLCNRSPPARISS
ncbi:DUF397 domain-containing protein, partial [Streptomyces sp. NPDC059618]|uniref:DUF397 domain-containing protein n=1 Tax=Streptomyces sp. NPDC059618 TaxID=3346887 RepID=UPI0036A31884